MLVISETNTAMSKVMMMILTHMMLSAKALEALHHSGKKACISALLHLSGSGRGAD
ncbi:hypothetical protein [Sinimarinibacterium sp. NLF-5-8]|uniref:hypothetical protein n=1 Tax=Sinimarinibacterium sp. NLF-5-8 TaxID=2698684 RepID=UPI001389A0F5|nr:hypothetical protein [Sinimarinibacterium sp. NLF-5-8]